MPALRPFPFPSLSIGTDIAHIPRIARLVASERTLPRFLRKVLTSREEREFHVRFSKSGYESSNSDSGIGGETQDSRWVDEAARFLAGRWAAKEAIVKACSWRSLTFDEIQIRKDVGSKRIYGVILDKPEIRRAMRQMHAEQDLCSNDEESEYVGEQRTDDPTGQVVKISISHDGEYATAVCMAAEEPTT